jgi:hypothetical protein
MSDARTPVGTIHGEQPPSETLKHLAYGEAAVMLIECLMLVLIDQRVFTVEQMVATVETAIATKRRMVEEREHPEIAVVAAGMLSTMANSLAASKSRPSGAAAERR